MISGPNSGSVASNITGASNIPWSSITNVYTLNGAAAGNNSDPGQVTDFIKLTGFGFSIPSDATIDGIVAEIWCTAGILRLTYLYLEKSGVVGSNLASFKPPTTGAYDSFGGSTNKWGTTWTPAEINASTFGLRLQYSAVDEYGEIYVDHIRITVYYTLPPVNVTPSAATSVGGKIDPSITLGLISMTPVASMAVAGKVDPTVGIAFNFAPAAPSSSVAAVVAPSILLGSVGVTPVASKGIAGKADPSIVLGTLEISLSVSAAVAATAPPSIRLGSVSVTPSAAFAFGATKDPTLSSLTWRNFWVNRGPGFKVGDLLIAQRKDFSATGEPFSVYQLKGRVTSIGVTATGEEYADIFVSEGYEFITDFEEQIEWIVIGNSIDAARSNLIYMTADEDFSPRMEMRSGVSSHELFGSMDSLRVALGNLGGIVDDVFGALTGYGLYADRVYLKGDMILGPDSTISWASVTDQPDIPTLPGYITETKITATTIESPTISTNALLTGSLTVQLGGTVAAGMTAETTGDSAVRIWAGAAYDDRASAPFRVTQGGAATCSNLTITGGSINLNSGVFAVTSAGAVTCSNLTITGGSINLNSGVFAVTSAGAVTCSNLTITGGSINLNSGVFAVTSAGAVTCSNLTITGGSINLNSGVFAVTSDGVMTAAKASISSDDGSHFLSLAAGAVTVTFSDPHAHTTTLDFNGIAGTFNGIPMFGFNSGNGSGAVKSLAINGYDAHGVSAWEGTAGATGPTYKRTLTIDDVSVDVACYN